MRVKKNENSQVVRFLCSSKPLYGFYHIAAFFVSFLTGYRNSGKGQFDLKRLSGDIKPLQSAKKRLRVIPETSAEPWAILRVIPETFTEPWAILRVTPGTFTELWAILRVIPGTSAGRWAILRVTPGTSAGSPAAFSGIPESFPEPEKYLLRNPGNDQRTVNECHGIYNQTVT